MGSIERVKAFDTGKSINPQWADDGRMLYFVGEPFGISNVYAVEIATGSVRQVTNLDTGVSGITALSPPYRWRPTHAGSHSARTTRAGLSFTSQTMRAC